MKDVPKFKRTAATVTAWIAVVLACYAVFVILNTWLLVPENFASVQDKLKIIAAFAVAFIGLVVLARWSFGKSKEFRVSDHSNIE